MKSKINRQVFKKVIGQSLRNKRTSKNLTLEKLASRVHLNEKHLGRLERGEKLPNAKTLFALQIELNFSTDEFIPKYQKEIKQLNQKEK